MDTSTSRASLGKTKKKREKKKQNTKRKEEDFFYWYGKIEVSSSDKISIHLKA
jgi:hypothetical protein